MGRIIELDIDVELHLNAQDRHDVGIFIAQDGLSPIVAASAGGSASCSVFGIPQSPLPFASLDGDACGDFDRNGYPQGFTTRVHVGFVAMKCVAGPTGKLRVPAALTWDANNNTCQAPVAEWLRPNAPSKCHSNLAAEIPTITVEPGGTGSITIVKNTDSADGTFAFTGSPNLPAADQSFSITTVANTGTRVITGLAAGTYTVSEIIPAGWTLDGLVCDDPTPTGTTTNLETGTAIINLETSDEHVTCTYTDAKIPGGTIAIVKNTTIDNDGTFAFTGSANLPAADQSFSITTVANTGTRVITGLGAGTYTVSEIIPAGWTLDGLVCTDPSGGTTATLATGTALIALATDETVTCTFTNDFIQAPPAPEESKLIPTLSEWGMIIMAALMVVVAGFTMRRRR